MAVNNLLARDDEGDEDLDDDYVGGKMFILSNQFLSNRLLILFF